MEKINGKQTTTKTCSWVNGLATQTIATPGLKKTILTAQKYGSNFWRVVSSVIFFIFACWINITFKLHAFEYICFVSQIAVRQDRNEGAAISCGLPWSVVQLFSAAILGKSNSSWSFCEMKVLFTNEVHINSGVLIVVRLSNNWKVWNYSRHIGPSDLQKWINVSTLCPFKRYKSFRLRTIRFGRFIKCDDSLLIYCTHAVWWIITKLLAVQYWTKSQLPPFEDFCQS